MPRIGPEEKEEAALWLAEGKPTDWVAARFGVSVTTVRRWRRDDPVFKAVYERQLRGLTGLGLLAVAEQRAAPPARLRAKPGTPARQVLKDAMTETGRKEARRGR